MINSNQYAKISKALSICMPETNEEAEADCDECPFASECKEEEYGITLPSVLMMEIRNYFSNNWNLKTKIQ